MQRQPLEQFIKSNRETFDDASPSPRLWNHIASELDQRRGKRVVMWRTLRAIAAALALLITGAGIGSYFAQQQAVSIATIEGVMPEYSEMERYYQQQIQEKYQQLAAHDKTELVAGDLKQLDKVMQELKAELLKAPRGKEEQIVENLIQSYRTKIEILSRVLERMQTSNQNNTDDEISI